MSARSMKVYCKYRTASRVTAKKHHPLKHIFISRDTRLGAKLGHKNEKTYSSCTFVEENLPRCVQLQVRRANYTNEIQKKKEKHVSEEVRFYQRLKVSLQTFAR